MLRRVLSKKTVGTTHAISKGGDEIKIRAEDNGLDGLEGGTKMQLNRVSHGPTIIWLLIPLLAAFGCGTRVFPRLSKEPQAQLGTIGIVSARITPAAKFNVGHIDATTRRGGATTDEVITGSAAGVLIGGGTGAVVGCLVGLACGPLFAPVCCAVFGLWGLGGGAATGAIAGGTITYLTANGEESPAGTTDASPTEVIKAHQKGTAEGLTAETTKQPAIVRSQKISTGEEIETNIKKVLSTLMLQEGVRDNVLRIGQAQTGHSFVLLNNLGPTILGEEISYQPLKSDGIDTILELTVETVGWTGKDFDAISPPVSLFMTARTRLIRVSDDRVLSSHIDRYKGIERSLSDWDDQVFREEIDYASQWLGERIVARVFLGVTTSENEECEEEAWKYHCD